MFPLNYSTVLVAAAAVVLASTTPSSVTAFVTKIAPLQQHVATQVKSTTETTEYSQLDERTKKPTGISFLSEEVIERAKKGSPIEKIKLAKDGTSAFVDVYEYARKIREGEMTWEEVEKADLESVRTQLRLFL